VGSRIDEAVMVAQRTALGKRPDGCEDGRRETEGNALGTPTESACMLPINDSLASFRAEVVCMAAYMAGLRSERSPLSFLSVP